MGNTRTSADVKNELRMPFAEWLYRMSECDVPYQARSLAVYAVAFRITSNEELARLVGMDTKGVADKTYNKWKRCLSDDGWVIVKQITVGRQTTVEVHPAFKCTPVTFTDLTPRDPRKFYDPSSVTITDVVAVESTGEPGKSYGPAVEIAAVAKEKVSPVPPLKENTNTQPSAAADSVSSCDEIEGLNGATFEITQFIASNMAVTLSEARIMLASDVRIFSADAIAAAYAKTRAELGPGSKVTRPYKYLIEAARGIKDGQQKRHQAEPKETMRERTRRFVAEAEEKIRKGLRP